LRAQIIPSDPITGFLYVDLVFTEGDDNKSISYKNTFQILPTVSYKSGNMMASMTKILDKINALPLDKLLASLDSMVVHSDSMLSNADTLVKHTDGLVKGIDKPLVALVSDLKTTILNLNKMTSKKSFERLPTEMNKSLKSLKVTLKNADKVIKNYGGNSLLSRQLADTLKIVTQTSKEMRLFLKMLNRKPNSLIFGDK